MYYAHSTANLDQVDWEPLADHLRAVAHGAERRAAKFGAGPWGYAAGLMHDLGKYADGFQQLLDGKAGRVDHSTAGAIEAGKRFGQLLARPLQFAIAGHHAGLADGLMGFGRPLGTSSRSSLAERLERTVEDYSAFTEEITLPTALSQLSLDLQNGRIGFQLAVFTRMLFSCLVDADFLETERFYNGGKIRTTVGGGPEALKARLERHLAKTLAGAPSTAINQHRRNILDACRAAAEQSPGLFSLTVPTGGGKTLSSLTFALDHAVKHGLDRIIYVIPFTSIIEQNAKVFRQALGDESVLEHHTAFRDDETKHPEGENKLKLAMENWDAPVVVTTTVQFFESLFADRSSRCRKLHNIANSVIILDEAQSLPLPVLKPCVAMLDELARSYGASIVLCTATQPALQERPEDPDRSFEGGLRDVREIAPEPEALYRAFKRVDVDDLGELNDQALATRLRKHECALCIVNTRDHARVLFEQLGPADGYFHLSALMCPMHRSQCLDKIKARLGSSECCIVISTSLVEAGVDLDFPVVYRAETGLDSIAQAAGRCNREGKLERGKVFVFRPSDRSLHGEMDRRAKAARLVLRKQGEDPLALQAIEAFFREIYWSEAEGLDRHEILPMLERSSKELMLPFQTVAATFRLIESAMLPVLIAWDDKARLLLEELAHTDQVGEMARKLQPYIVQLHEWQLQTLRTHGAVQPINPNRFGEQFCRLVSEGLYHDDIGLVWDDPTFRQAGENLF